MVDVKNTPGPWKAERPNGMIKTENGVLVGMAYGDNPECNEDDRQIANARLMAAAPDLLAALKDADDALEDLRVPASAGPNRFERVVLDVLVKIRAAIAKAEGKDVG